MLHNEAPRAIAGLFPSFPLLPVRCDQWCKGLLPPHSGRAALRRLGRRVANCGIMPAPPPKGALLVGSSPRCNDDISAAMLSRLRRHRWMFGLAMVVLSFKLIAGTVCLNDAATTRHAATLATGAAAVAAPMVGSSGADGGCLLGESGGCHCACPEASPVPVTLQWSVGGFDSRFAFRVPDYAFAPARAAPPFRPPIA